MSAKDRKLEKPAQVGNTRFSAGVSERLVIERAQREYEYQNTPEKEMERLKNIESSWKPVLCNLPFERVPQHANDPGFGPVPPETNVIGIEANQPADAVKPMNDNLKQ